MQLVAISCILIGAKYEEAEENVPSSAELNEFAQHEYSTEMIQQMELTVLNRLDWCLTAVTPLHFLGYYLAKGALFVDDLMQGKPLLEKVPRWLLDRCLPFFSRLFTHMPTLQFNLQVFAKVRGVFFGPLLARIFLSSVPPLNIVGSYP
jgi:hypothetical protein